MQLLAARLVLDEGFRPEDAVATAADLVAEGVDCAEVVALAAQPADPLRIDGHETEALFRDAIEVLGIATSTEAAGWTLARWIAEAMMNGTIPAPTGAHRLWWLSTECGDPGEFAWMLQLLDAWESSVGREAAALEAEMIAYAPAVVEAADRALGSGA